MVYIITLTYRVAAQALSVHLQAHQQWLRAQLDAGLFLAAGPSDDGMGGIVLAHTTDRTALERAVAADPFVVHQLVDVSVQGFTPVVRAEGFLNG
ncbi:YciI family protein [Xanthomonas floridensis]|uniref:YciI family protein n=1 Tax=Xanthomonas floridensis TaxID=1843580 RepID=A0A1A9M6Q2_9XANT|nr:YciI family protein [Xanthomonas floridensis]MEA5122646.1 YciI family protein [Xanthomonas floridensis]MEA5131314.1 YciI family protein [Xanthomonas floridensis]OAG66174.1 hypothetical protein A7D17_04385 [Xanthomonas floridensis]